MDKIQWVYPWLLVICFLFPGVSMATENHKVPILVIPPENPQDTVSPRESEATIRLVRRYFHLEAADTPYGQVKVNVLRDADRKIRRLVVYLMHRDTYLVDIVQLTVDDDFNVVAVDKSPG